MMIYQTKYLEQINTLFKKRNESLPIKNDDKIRLEKKYRLEFNYNSNHMEGNTLTYGQTQLLLFFDKSSGDVPMSDLEEMKAHDAALRIIKEMASDKERPLNEQFIKELNSIILVRPFWTEAITENGQQTRKKIVPGEYKSLPNSVRLRNGEIHHYASPEETPAKMNDLMDWYQSEKNKMHPVQLAAEFHYRFVCIHPFDDGNGRVARLIMNYILLFNDYPMVIIKSKDKENYLTALQKADVGEKQAIIEYIEKQMLWSLNLELKAANGEDLEEEDDIDKEIELLKREKLRNIKKFKSEESLSELVKNISEVWNVFQQKLRRFDEFFMDIDFKSYYSYGETKNDLKKYKFEQLFIRKFDPDFGIYFKNAQDFKKVQYLIWERKHFNLKLTEEKIDVRILFVVELFDNYYIIKVEFSDISNYPRVKERTKVFDGKYNYNQDLEVVLFDQAIKNTLNVMLEYIKIKS